MAQLRTFLENALVFDKQQMGSMAIEVMVISLEPHDKGWRIVLRTPVFDRIKKGRGARKIHVTLRSDPPGVVVGDLMGR